MPIETWSRCIHVICIDMFHVFHSPCFSFRWLFERLGALPSGGIGPPAASYMCGCPLGGRGAFFQWRIWCNSGLRGKIREAFMTFHEFFSFSCSLYHPVVPLHGVGMPILLSLLSNQPRWSIFVFAQQRVGLMLHMSTTPWTDDPFFFLQVASNRHHCLLYFRVIVIVIVSFGLSYCIAGHLWHAWERHPARCCRGP